jgi:hypothetical protein
LAGHGELARERPSLALESLHLRLPLVALGPALLGLPLRRLGLLLRYNEVALECRNPLLVRAEVGDCGNGRANRLGRPPE